MEGGHSPDYQLCWYTIPIAMATRPVTQPTPVGDFTTMAVADLTTNTGVKTDSQRKMRRHKMKNTTVKIKGVFKIHNLAWNEGLSNEESEDFSTLSKTIETGLEELLGSHEPGSFPWVHVDRFSAGSVVCHVSVSMHTVGTTVDTLQVLHNIFTTSEGTFFQIFSISQPVFTPARDTADSEPLEIITEEEKESRKSW